MREIKFRFWLPFLYNGVIEGGCWLDPEYHMVNGIGQIGDCSEGEFWELRKEAIAEQFTGLLDKNGKEIYEGDILDGGIEGTYIVFWHESSASFCIGCDHASALPMVTCPVIGNVHENPELLK